VTSRERVLRALNHEEPDRVPLDLGGSITSGITALALDRLRRYLRLDERPVRVYELFQMLGEVEMDVVERLGIDVLPVETPVQFFGIRREKYKPWKLLDGTPVLVPGQFDVEVDAEGGWLIHTEGRMDLPVEGHMPKDGYYFDKYSMLYEQPDFVPPPLEEIRRENHLTREALELMAARSEKLRRETDKALCLGGALGTGLAPVGSIPDFLFLLAADKAYVKDMFEVRTEVALENLALLKRYLGNSIDIINIDGYDFGSQNGELFSPDLTAELFLPNMKLQTAWVHRNTPWKTYYHACGSITRVIPMLIEGGMDILNPVQASAKGMDPAWLKRQFGDRITFWGGGVDTQRTLPFGTPEEVAHEVQERMRIFAPGGGFVFNPVHNVQFGTPPENIVAAYETARAAGGYPIRAL
jgi:hypothetical protein